MWSHATGAGALAACGDVLTAIAVVRLAHAVLIVWCFALLLITGRGQLGNKCDRARSASS